VTAQGKNSRKTGLGRAFGAAVGASLFLGAITAHAAMAAGDDLLAAPPLNDSGSRFTPARGDARLAKIVARSSSERKFAFTPARVEHDRDDHVRVALRADSNGQGKRAAASAETRAVAGNSASSALTPNSYNLGVAVGWKRFAVSGDVSQSRSAVPAIADRDRAQVGLSYNDDGKVSPRVSVSGERSASPAPVLAPRDSYSLDVGGKINISKKIAVTGGVRYRIDQDRIDPALEDARRDSQAVYVGTKLRF
jgi:hypothetical protein